MLSLHLRHPRQVYLTLLYIYRAYYKKARVLYLLLVPLLKASRIAPIVRRATRRAHAMMHITILSFSSIQRTKKVDINTSCGHLPVALPLTIDRSLRDFEQPKNKALINAFSVNASPPIRHAHYSVPLLPNKDNAKVQKLFQETNKNEEKYNLWHKDLEILFAENG